MASFLTARNATLVRAIELDFILLAISGHSVMALANEEERLRKYLANLISLIKNLNFRPRDLNQCTAVISGTRSCRR